MKKHYALSPLLLAALALLCACTASPTAAATSAAPSATTASSWSDPFAYCAAVGTVDAPDARYSGPDITDVIVQGYIRAAGLQEGAEPADEFKKSTTWRCMGGELYACNFGANLPCTSKAETSRTPTAEMSEFCRANPGAEFIPMYITGHATLYGWGCAGEVPEVREQLDQPDAAGFLSRIWYRIPAP